MARWVRSLTFSLMVQSSLKKSAESGRSVSAPPSPGDGKSVHSSLNMYLLLSASGHPQAKPV